MRSNVLLKIIGRTWRLPEGVPSDLENFLSDDLSAHLKWFFKYLKRRVFYFILVENFGFMPERKRILSKHKKILWVNLAAPSLGDSLMDLSARCMLEDRDLVLLTDKKNAPLFLGDQYFSAVYSSVRELRMDGHCGSFDLVICDSYSPRVLLKKIIAAPRVDFIGLYGFVNGFEVHRTYFAFARMRELLSQSECRFPVKPILSVSQGGPSFGHFDVCVAIGGEWGFRTYKYWEAVLTWMVSQRFSVVLVGSYNGSELATEIQTLLPDIQSFVGRSTLPDVIKLIDGADVFVGADGGLWHIACALSKPSVVLFADCQIFDRKGRRITRETTDIFCESLYDVADVSNIHSASVIEAFRRLHSKLTEQDCRD
ncbi:hypothetical protein N9W31_00470 [Litoricolaceae bacterium]|nr:hypothetical protein [Litorivicinaceae bacterium]